MKDEICRKNDVQKFPSLDPKSLETKRNHVFKNDFSTIEKVFYTESATKFVEFIYKKLNERGKLSQKRSPKVSLIRSKIFWNVKKSCSPQAFVCKWKVYKNSLDWIRFFFNTESAFLHSISRIYLQGWMKDETRRERQITDRHVRESEVDCPLLA